jgi:hypothetical protein
MRIVPAIYRPSILAAIFGSYLALIMLSSWSFASGLPNPSYSAELSRWIYAAYLVASAAFLAGLAVLAFHIHGAFEARAREVNRELGSLLLGGGAAFISPDVLPPPSGGSSEPSDSDLKEILETLGEAQTQEVLLVPSSSAGPEAKALNTLQRALLHRRDDLRRRQLALTKFLPGPSVVAVAFVGLSAAMLPTTDAMLQSFYQINTTLILGFAYGWVGLAAYFAISLLGVAGALKTEGKRRPRRVNAPQAKGNRTAARSNSRVARYGR